MTDAQQTPTPPENTESNDVELLSERNQRLIAFGAVLGILMLVAQHVLIATHFHGWVIVSASTVSFIGWALFLLGAYLNRRLKGTPEGRAFIEHAAHDERIIHIRSQSFAFGFTAMMAFQVLLIVLDLVFGHLESQLMSVPVIAPATIAAGITGAVLRFQFLSSR